MQRVFKVQGGLKAYSATPDMLLATSGARECPFCRDRHRLRRHGHYHRFALLPGEQEPVRVPIRRLLCARTGKTVSLLPDFCLPRLLTSFDGDSRDDLTMVLCGHPQLESNLRLAINEALAQRIVLRVRTRSLHANEVDGYLRFRLERAGRSAKLFLPDAVEAIARAARGIPRLVDRLAEHSMLIALRGKRTEIDADIVTEAIDEVDP